MLESVNHQSSGRTPVYRGTRGRNRIDQQIAPRPRCQINTVGPQGGDAVRPLGRHNQGCGRVPDHGADQVHVFGNDRTGRRLLDLPFGMNLHISGKQDLSIQQHIGIGLNQ